VPSRMKRHGPFMVGPLATARGERRARPGDTAGGGRRGGIINMIMDISIISMNSFISIIFIIISSIVISI
jgi:hypothetical protein